MALDPKLLEILACPKDKGPLLYFADEESLYNPRLRLRYRITDDIPVMLTDEAETVDDWSQGVPLVYLQDLCHYWSEQYDWRRTERRINAIPQFVTDIDGVEIHFLHARSPHPGALPLIVTHGWPGSVIEFLKVIGPLTDPVAHGGDAADAALQERRDRCGQHLRLGVNGVGVQNVEDLALGFDGIAIMDHKRPPEGDIQLIQLRRQTAPRRHQHDRLRTLC